MHVALYQICYAFNKLLVKKIGILVSIPIRSNLNYIHNDFGKMYMPQLSLLILLFSKFDMTASRLLVVKTDMALDITDFIVQEN